MNRLFRNAHCGPLLRTVEVEIMLRGSFAATGNVDGGRGEGWSNVAFGETGQVRQRALSG
jgi:hypothetical protein